MTGKMKEDKRRRKHVHANTCILRRVLLSPKGTMSESSALQAPTISEGPQQNILSLDFLD